MKTLQQLIRTISVHDIFTTNPTLGEMTTEFKSFYMGLADTEGVIPQCSQIIFASAYYNIDLNVNNPDFAASVYDVSSNKVSGIVFVPQKVLLGYLVSDMSIMMYGKERVLGAILNEMTLFGLSEHAVETEKLAMQADSADDEWVDSIHKVLSEMGLSLEDIEMTDEENAHAQLVFDKNAAIRDVQLAAIHAMLAQ